MARILLIDDEPEVCRLLRRMLETAASHDVLEAHDGKAGLKTAAKKQPDAILLDINMPGMDGIQVLEKLGADPKTKFIPVIMLTGDDTEEMKRIAMQGFADQYLVKPVSQETLLAALGRVLPADAGER